MGVVWLLLVALCALGGFLALADRSGTLMVWMLLTVACFIFWYSVIVLVRAAL